MDTNKKNSNNISGSDNPDHKLTLKNRKQLEISGIKEVVSYNESKIIVQTTLGTLNIDGKNLNIKKLNLEQTNINIEGNINNLQYSNKSPHHKNILQRIFK